MMGFDVAVIPYMASFSNHFCSPMGFYDHLEISRPIIATPHCRQIAAYPRVISGTTSDVPEIIAHAGHGRP